MPVVFDATAVPVEDNVPTNSGTTESSKLLKPAVNDVTFKFEQTWDALSSPKSSWQAVGEPDAPTWKLGHPGYLGFLGNVGSTVASQKNACAIFSPKSAWSLSRSSEIAVP